MSLYHIWFPAWILVGQFGLALCQLFGIGKHRQFFENWHRNRYFFEYRNRHRRKIWNRYIPISYWFLLIYAIPNFSTVCTKRTFLSEFFRPPIIDLHNLFARLLLKAKNTRGLSFFSPKVCQLFLTFFGIAFRANFLFSINHLLVICESFVRCGASFWSISPSMPITPCWNVITRYVKFLRRLWGLIEVLKNEIWVPLIRKNHEGIGFLFSDPIFPVWAPIFPVCTLGVSSKNALY